MSAGAVCYNSCFDVHGYLQVDIPHIFNMASHLNNEQTIYTKHQRHFDMVGVPYIDYAALHRCSCTCFRVFMTKLMLPVLNCVIIQKWKLLIKT